MITIEFHENRSVLSGVKKKLNEIGTLWERISVRRSLCVTTQISETESRTDIWDATLERSRSAAQRQTKFDRNVTTGGPSN
jgi:hypothetical protein